MAIRYWLVRRKRQKENAENGEGDNNSYVEEDNNSIQTIQNSSSSTYNPGGWGQSRNNSIINYNA